MDVQSLLQINAPIVVSTMMPEARALPETEQKSSKQKIEDQSSVKVNLSSSAQNLFSSSGDVSGSKPVPESDESESNPSQDGDANSRNAEDKSGKQSEDLAKAFKTLMG